MNLEDDTQESGAITGPTKQAYQSPQLRNYGSLAEMTDSTMGGMSIDASGMGKSGS